MSAPVTITETVEERETWWGVAPVSMPLDVARLNADWYTRRDAAEYFLRTRNRAGMRPSRLLRLETVHIITPLEPPDDPQSDEGGEGGATS